MTLRTLLYLGKNSNSYTCVTSRFRYAGPNFDDPNPETFGANRVAVPSRMDELIPRISGRRPRPIAADPSRRRPLIQPDPEWPSRRGGE